MTAATLSRGYRVSRGMILPVLLLALWEAGHRLAWFDPGIIPSPLAVVARLQSEMLSGRLLLNLGTSLLRDIVGFTLGSAAGVLAGLVLGGWPPLARLFGPSFDGWKQIAIFAWIPLISLWFGVGEAAKLVFIALAAFTPVAVNTQQGVRDLDPRHREVARVLTFTGWQSLTKLVLPAAAPAIFTGLHLALIYSWLATVGAEYFMTIGPGIGGMMTEGREHFHMDLVILGVLILGLVGFLLNHGAAMLETRLLRWRHP